MIMGFPKADLARIRVVVQLELGVWLHVNGLRVAVVLRVSCKEYEFHRCISGSMMDVNGQHALSCSLCSGKYHALNDIWREFVSTDVLCTYARTSWSMQDPGGLHPMWDTTCFSTVAASRYHCRHQRKMPLKGRG